MPSFVPKQICNEKSVLSTCRHFLVRLVVKAQPFRFHPVSLFLSFFISWFLPLLNVFINESGACKHSTGNVCLQSCKNLLEIICSLAGPLIVVNILKTMGCVIHVVGFRDSNGFRSCPIRGKGAFINCDQGDRPFSRGNTLKK